MNSFIILALLPFFVAASPVGTSVPSSEAANATEIFVSASEFSNQPNATAVPSNASSIEPPPVTSLPSAVPTSVEYNPSSEFNFTTVYSSAFPEASEIPGNMSSVIYSSSNDTSFPSGVYGTPASSIGVYPSSNGTFPSNASSIDAYPTSIGSAFRSIISSVPTRVPISSVAPSLPSSIRYSSRGKKLFPSTSAYDIPSSIAPSNPSAFPTASSDDSSPSSVSYIESGSPSSADVFPSESSVDAFPSVGLQTGSPSSVYDYESEYPSSSAIGGGSESAGYPTSSVYFSSELPVSTA
ncbi:hypothetical protein ONZ45_g4695 [Pleurotus djamor]|nr:hypothetical protein ONZ45_g4695 [Pleurotus djamor]